MKTFTKNSGLVKWGCLFVLAMTFTIISGCQTAEGFGRDVKGAGEAIEREAR
jgi:predicted small secreted protein